MDIVGVFVVSAVDQPTLAVDRFGFLGMLCAAYIAIACLVFHSNPNTQTSDGTYLMGYLLALATLVASFGLVYAAVQTDNPKAFSFV